MLQIVNELPSHVFWKDKEGVYIGCNNAFSSTFDLKPEEIVGKTDYDLPVEPETASAFIHDDRHVMESKQPKLNILEQQTFLNGSEKILLTSKVPLLSENGDVMGILGIYTDVTEKKQLENELIARNKELKHGKLQLEKVLSRYKKFVLNQEHDMRIPASNVLGLANALLLHLTDPECIEMAEYLRKSAQAQLDYQNSLLDIIYLFNEETELYRRRFELKKVFKQIEDMFLCSFREKQLDFILEYDNNLPRILVGDWFRLQQILLRLISNAVEFTEPGGKIWLRCKGEQQKERERECLLIVEIEDTGIGIVQEDLDVIFEPFVRLTLSNIGKYAGRGVGLTFVKKLVEDLRGEIDVKSILGEGTIFQLFIPYTISLSNKPTSELSTAKKI